MKKIFTAIVVAALILSLTGCSNSIFMMNYQTFSTDREYLDYCFDNSLYDASKIMTKGKYNVKGEFLLMRATSYTYYNADLEIDIDKKTVTGKRQTLRGKEINYMTKDGKVYKVFDGTTEPIDFFQTRLIKVIDFPEAAYNYYSAVYDNLLEMPCSYVGVAADSSIKMHVKITPQSASYLLYDGVMPESAVGDMYISINKEGYVNGVKFYLDVMLGDSLDYVGDIISGVTTLYDRVYADFSVTPA